MFCMVGFTNYFIISIKYKSIVGGFLSEGGGGGCFNFTGDY